MTVSVANAEDNPQTSDAARDTLRMATAAMGAGKLAQGELPSLEGWSWDEG